MTELDTISPSPVVMISGLISDNAGSPVHCERGQCRNYPVKLPQTLPGGNGCGSWTLGTLGTGHTRARLPTSPPARSQGRTSGD